MLQSNRIRSLLACTLLLVIISGLFKATSADWPFRRSRKNLTPVQLLARKIDDVEKKLNNTGTVVAKRPDIWGESRLTRHRQEIEKQLAERIDKFELLLNGSVSRSDQAFLANALALTATVQGSSFSKLDADEVTIQTPGPEGAGPQQTMVPIFNTSTMNSLLQPSAVELKPDGSSTVNRSVVGTPPFGLLDRSFIKTGEGGKGFGFKDSAVTLEPTIVLDQLHRYLQHLQELRRLNEGGDTADSPGYSLNLVRMPVSVIPGDQTRKGHGATVTITAKAHLTEELLPKTFRSLVINDLVDQLALPLTKLAEHADDTSSQTSSSPKRTLSDFRTFYGQNFATAAAAEHSPIMTSRARRARYAIPPSRLVSIYGKKELDIVGGLLAGALLSECEGTTIHLSDARGLLNEELQAAYTYLSSPQGICLWDKTGQIREAIHLGHQTTIKKLREEVTSHYAACPVPLALSRSNPPPAPGLKVPPTPEKVLFVQNKNNDTKAGVDPDAQYIVDPDAQYIQVRQALAWAILVESTMLNERLNEDVKRISRDPECPCNFAEWYDFCRPNANSGARAAFIAYVDCRWPIHVFAIDPIHQDQNIADSFSMRREMQLAISLAFVGGDISAQQMTRYVRRLELDMQTVALNRTVVGFGHGDDTFGWRFYPRVQTPDFESNMTVAFRDLIVGGPNKDHLLRKHQLEPGMRELTALVIMPSFINHMRFDVRSDFFELVDPDDTQASMEKTIEISRNIKEMEELAVCCYEEAEFYRHGEVERMLARVKQLSNKMPLQTLYTQVPNENTLGGFEMFSSGVTDLSPELIDFYGLPGIDPGKNTKLFLVGKNFSVHDTRVLAGNRTCDFELVSRGIMEVTIPAGIQFVECRKLEQGPTQCSCENSSSTKTTPCTKCKSYQTKRHVDVHVSTPYGVSRHLHIPVITGNTSPEIPGFQWVPENIAATYYWNIPDPMKPTEFAIASVQLAEPKQLVFKVPKELRPDDAVKFNFDLQISTSVVTGTDKDLSVSLVEGVEAEYDASAGGYLITGANLFKLHREVLSRVASQLKARFPKGIASVKTVEVKLIGSIKTATGIFKPTLRNNPVLLIDLKKLN